jgi:hypothetical protein
MSPEIFLAAMLLITAGAWLGRRMIRRRRQRVLQQLATQWQMHYSPADRFHLGQRISKHFPVCGAGDLYVRDLIYGSGEGRYRYVFTAEFTQGVVRAKRRVRRVAAFTEPKDLARQDQDIRVELAPAELSLLEQYKCHAGADRQTVS